MKLLLAILSTKSGLATIVIIILSFFVITSDFLFPFAIHFLNMRGFHPDKVVANRLLFIAVLVATVLIRIIAAKRSEKKDHRNCVYK